MNTLIAIYDEQTLPGQANAVPLVKVTMKTGRELYLCNDYEDVRDALGSSDMFEAHIVVGMKPKAITINPMWVATAEDLR